jgi:hypothetical protein
VETILLSQEIIDVKKKDQNPEGNEIAGQYANYFQVGYNAFEFVMDFGQLYEQSDNAHIHTRIITSPVYAKELLELLSDSIESYEKKFPTLVDSDEPTEPKK